MQTDPSNPDHYKGDKKLQAIDAIESFNLNFNLGNVLKYIVRCDKKSDRKTDLIKALWYLNREVSKYK